MHERFYFYQNTATVRLPFSHLGMSVIELRLIPESTPTFQVTKAPHRVFRVLGGGIELSVNGKRRHALNTHDLIAISNGDSCLIRNLSRDITVVEVISASDALEKFIRSVGNPKSGQKLPENADELAAAMGLEVYNPAQPAPVIQPYRIPVNQLQSGITRSI